MRNHLPSNYIFFIFLVSTTDASSNHETRISALEDGGGSEKLLYDESASVDFDRRDYVGQLPIPLNFQNIFNAIKNDSPFFVRIVYTLWGSFAKYGGATSSKCVIGIGSTVTGTFIAIYPDDTTFKDYSLIHDVKTYACSIITDGITPPSDYSFAYDTTDKIRFTQDNIYSAGKAFNAYYDYCKAGTLYTNIKIYKLNQLFSTSL